MTDLVEKHWEISYCGLNCANCDIFLASHGNEKLQQELVKWFKNNVDANIEYLSCEKCKGPKQKCWSSKCELRSCATKMKITYCFECSEFVCDKLNKFANDGIAHHGRTVENMKEMKKEGLKKWISFLKEPKFCP